MAGGGVVEAPAHGPAGEGHDLRQLQVAYSQSKLASVTVPTRSPAFWRAGFGAYLAVDVSLVVDMLPVTPVRRVS
jgi:hypothetical protein